MFAQKEYKCHWTTSRQLMEVCLYNLQSMLGFHLHFLVAIAKLEIACENLKVASSCQGAYSPLKSLKTLENQVAPGKPLISLKEMQSYPLILLLSP